MVADIADFDHERIARRAEKEKTEWLSRADEEGRASKGPTPLRFKIVAPCRLPPAIGAVKPDFPLDVEPPLDYFWLVYSFDK
jgi:hypothetical protein